MNPAVERFRRDWDDAYRRLELASKDPARAERLRSQLDVVSAELRRRVGQTFTLGMLAEEYEASDAWTRQAIEEQAATLGWARDVSLVSDAAFHVYARGAVDYAP